MAVEKISSPELDGRTGQHEDRRSNYSVPQRSPQNVDTDYVNRQLLVLLQALAGMNETSEGKLKTNKPSFESDDVIEAVQLFFDSILTSEYCSSAVMTLVGMLQIPVLKSAAASDRFLTDQRHPARRLIKALFVVANDIDVVKPVLDSSSVDKVSSDALGDDVAENDHAVYRSLLSIVKTVVHGYNGDDRVFLQAYFDVCQLQK